MTRRSLLAGLIPAGLAAQSGRLTQGAHWMELILERHENGTWRPVEPGLVFDSGDLVRFRFRSNFDGYLYVINAGTSGVQSLLFPAESSGTKNRVNAAAEYTVPSTGASFKVAGPAGHDIVYWLISPVALAGDPAASLTRQDPAPKLIPRCDSSFLRSRGLCIDSTAGPRNVKEEEALPAAISSIPKMTRRELTIVQRKEVSRVAAPTGLNGPVVYEFRLAHR